MAQNGDTSKLTGLRKRQQITKTNKAIFGWVAGAAVLVTICGVFIQFLVQQLIFNQTIIQAKTNTQAIVSQNKQNAEALKQEIDKLVADTNLSKVKPSVVAGTEASNLQVILDALPTVSDSATFANSLSKVILPLSGVSIESISVEDVSGSGADIVATETTTTVESGGAQTLGFTFSVKGTYEQVQTVLADLTRVIRPITINSLTLQGDGSNLAAVVTGVTYSLPSTTVNLESKQLKP
ncbi:MAG TPA: hypothetical protein PKD68_02815 [Candidatus Saccharibacteria bacterium]|nr:hypothetical protein [Candidatus Saccharibacteria bacterium]